MDVFGNLTANGTSVRSYPCNYTYAQVWDIIDSGNTLRNKGKCLDARDGGTTNGTPLDLWDCNGTGSQVFIPRFINRQFFTLYNPQSNKCVDIPGDATGPVNLDLWDCNGTAAQLWYI